MVAPDVNWVNKRQPGSVGCALMLRNLTGVFRLLIYLMAPHHSDHHPLCLKMVEGIESHIHSASSLAYTIISSL